MGASVIRGFVVGFVAVAAILGAVAWQMGWLSPAAPGDPLEVLVVPKVPERGAPADAPRAGKDPAPPAGAVPSAPPPAAESGARKPAGDGVAARTPSAPPAPPKADAPAEKGAFDIVRVEPSGDLVVAGRCPAGCTAELTANGEPKDKVEADAAGNFAMTPPPLPPGDHQLGLRVTTPDGKSATSEQTVTVSVPKAPSREVIVVLNEPDAPSKVLQRPGQAPAAAPRPGTPPPADLAARPPAAPERPKTPAQSVAALSLGAVDAERGRFFVQGTAPAAARLRVYLNNALIAEPVASADERWSVRVERGISPGRYVARVDHIGPDGKVLARAEQAFAYEADAEVAAAAPAKPRPKEDVAAVRPSPKPDGKAASGQPPRAGEGAGAPSGDVSKPPAAAPSGAGAESPSPAAAATAQTGSGPAGPDPKAPAEASAATSPVTGGGATPAQPPAEPTPKPVAPVAEATPPRPEDAPLSESPAAPPDPANPVVAAIETAQVTRGDSLWRISRKTYGRGMRYTAIFTANDDQIRNPNLIYPGQVLVLPADNAEGPGAAAR